MSLKLSVRLSRRAIRDLKGIYAWIAEGSQSAADAWLDATHAEIASLDSFPERCGAAREAGILGTSIRQLVVGRYRVLFAVDAAVVHVLHVRHASMDNATADDLE